MRSGNHEYELLCLPSIRPLAGGPLRAGPRRATLTTGRQATCHADLPVIKHCLITCLLQGYGLHMLEHCQRGPSEQLGHPVSNTWLLYANITLCLQQDMTLRTMVQLKLEHPVELHWSTHLQLEHFAICVGYAII